VTADAARLWAAYLAFQANPPRCVSRCRLCPWSAVSHDPVAAHLEREHGGITVTLDPEAWTRGVLPSPGRPVEPPPTTEASSAAPVGSAGTTHDTRHSIYARVR
jgi:hypothetical protein